MKYGGTIYIYKHSSNGISKNVGIFFCCFLHYLLYYRKYSVASPFMQARILALIIFISLSFFSSFVFAEEGYIGEDL